jgi:hypothetical protein
LVENVVEYLHPEMGRTNVIKIGKSQDGMQVDSAVVFVDGVGLHPQVSAGLLDID